jgi:hypothetical protein
MDVGELTEDAVNGLFHAQADPTCRDIIRRCAADEPRFLGKHARVRSCRRFALGESARHQEVTASERISPFELESEISE